MFLLAAALVAAGLAWGQTTGGGAPGAPAAPAAPGTPGTPAGPAAAPGQSAPPLALVAPGPAPTPGQPGSPLAVLPPLPGTAAPSPTVYTEPPLPLSTQADDFHRLPRFGAELFAAAAQAGLVPAQVVPNAPLGAAAGQGGAAPVNAAAGTPTGQPMTTPGAYRTAPGTYPTAPGQPTTPAGLPATTTGMPLPAPGLSAGAAGGAALTTPSGTTVVAQSGVAPLYPSGMMIPTAPGMTPPWAPVVNAPVPPNYVIGPGDALTLNVIAAGRTQINDTYTVTAEGYLFLPQLGRVAAAGERLEHLQTAVAQAYRQYYNDPVVTLVISQQRVVEVYVMGEVVRPGKYALTGMATVLTALYAAGGPAEIGTYRNLQLTRVGRPTVTIDLYDYLLAGKRDQDVMLEPGDNLFVPPLQGEVGLEGDVRRPARYEMKGATTVAQALAMAGGMAATGYAPVVQLWRLDPARQWQLTTLNLNQPGGPDPARPLRDGDLLVVPTALPEANNLVYLTGAVRRPGAYPAPAGATLGGVMAEAEGLDPSAHTGLGVLRRLKPDLNYETINFNVGDVVAGKPGADLPVQPNDIVQIFTKQDVEPPLQVEVRGAVVRAGIYPYALNLRLSQLVTIAGGPVPGAYLDRAEIMRLRPDQQRDVVPVDLQAALAGQRNADVTLARGDILQVHLRAELLPASLVRIQGFVTNPGTYPRAEGMRVSDLVYAAGGLLPGAGPTVQWVKGRYEGQPQPVALQLTGDANHFQVTPDPVLNDDDTVGVGGRGNFTAQPEMVSIAGEVEHPGALALPRAAGTENFTAWDLLQQGGPLLPDASLEGLIVYRTARPAATRGQAEDLAKVLAATNNQAHQEQAATGAVNASQQAAAQSAALTQNVTQGLATVLNGQGVVSLVLPPTAVSTAQAVSGIPLDGETLVASKGARGNLALQDGDYMVVPKQPATVTVLGAVARSGAVPLLAATTTKNRRSHAPTAADYVAVSGGFRDDAATDHLVVVHLNGAVTRAQLATPLRPGDVLVVPSHYVVRNVRTESELDSWLKAIVPLVATALVVKM